MISIKKDLFTILNRLNSNGYEAYLVGGAVRNYLLNKTIKDYDITTNAHPETVMMLFNDYKVYDIGRKLGTVAVVINHTTYEITPFRLEGEYKDHRHPDTIKFSDNLKDDLQRRDFTINALCLDSNLNIIDYFNGVQDLNNKIIKAIGNPNTRFNEDALRILRALRFKTKLNFTIEDKTNKALFKNKDLLNYISIERKKDELLQILSSRSAFNTINEYLDIFKTFIPLSKSKRKINDFNNPYYALAYLLKDNDSYNLKQLKLSNHEIDLINLLIQSTKININNDYEFITILSNRYQKDILNFLEKYYHKNLKDRYKKLHQYMIEINDLDITGQEIDKYKFKDKKISDIKQELLDLIYHKKLKNNNTLLHKHLKKNIL